MPSVVVEVTVKIDDQPIRGFPRAIRLSVDEIQTATPYEKTSGAGFVLLPTAELGTVQFLLVEPDQATTYRFGTDVNTAGDITLNANGLLLLVNSNQTDQPSVENTSGNTANLKLQAGGT